MRGTQTLYSIAEDLIRIEDMLEAGEIDSQTYDDTLDAYLKDATKEKLEAYAQAILDRDGRAKMKKAEIDRLKASMDADTATVKRLKDRMKWFMEATQKSELSGMISRLCLQSNGGKAALKLDASVDPEAGGDPRKAIHEGAEYFYLAPALDTTHIREALNSGLELPFATLDRGTHVRVR